jgi:uncharacterized protein (TIGR00251 family)
VVGARPWQVVAGGVIVVVRLTPKGGRDSLDGIEERAEGEPRARVRAAPHDGEANAALVRLLAKALKLAPRQIEIVAGAAARVKRVKISGDGPALAAALDRTRRGGAR